MDHIKESKQKINEGKQRKVPFSTLCKNFKSDHNIEDKQDKKRNNRKTKNGDDKTPKLPSEEQMSSSVSSSLDDVSSQENIQQIQSQGARTQNCSG